ncbi:hypothetical protein DHC50_08475 [Arenibacter sp. A80]|nr:hypothetical protein [Arenibacter sp. A80]RFT56357.1 hypothetical protein D0S24_08470 [Arenibacter sp. P308M17]
MSQKHAFFGTNEFIIKETFLGNHSLIITDVNICYFKYLPLFYIFGNILIYHSVKKYKGE